MNITPFSTFNTNFQRPFDHRYSTPVYDPTDLVGDFDDDGNPIGDGTPDNHGNISDSYTHLTLPTIDSL